MTDRLSSSLHVKNIIGDPFKVGKVTIIPIIMTDVGFGGGGDVDGAIEDLEFACKKDPFAEAYYYLGEAFQRKGLMDKAKEAYKKALELKPDYSEAAKALAEIK